MSINTLIVIDVQNFFVNQHTKSLPKKIASHIDKSLYDHVLFTKFVNKPSSNFFKILNWKQCAVSPQTDIHSDLLPLTNESNIFEKTSYSIFKAQGLLKYLKKNRITAINLCGADTDACILASAFEGFDLSYKITVIKNLCASHSGNKYHNSAISIIEKCLK